MIWIKEKIKPKLDSKNRFRVKFCPCGKSNRDGKFVPFTGFEDKGYCHSCDKTFFPDDIHNKGYTELLTPKENVYEYIPWEVFSQIRNEGRELNNQNHFLQYLTNEKRKDFAFDNEILNNLLETYFLTSHKKYPGWVLFPYIDINGRVRNIKAMDYNPDTGKRITNPFPKVRFIGKEILNNYDANLESCFYGEHLLTGNNKPVKIFESEATATYAQPFFLDHVCLATGGKNGCKWTEIEKLSVLEGHEVTLYPDIDSHDIWMQKAGILYSYGIDIRISDLVIAKAKEFAKGDENVFNNLVAEKYDLRDFLKHQKLIDIIDKNKEAIDKKENTYLSKPIQTDNWEQEIHELENFFNSIEIPDHPIELKYYIVQYPKRFISEYFGAVKKYAGNRSFLKYLIMLLEFKQILTTN